MRELVKLLTWGAINLAGPDLPMLLCADRLRLEQLGWSIRFCAKTYTAERSAWLARRPANCEAWACGCDTRQQTIQWSVLRFSVLTKIVPTHALRRCILCFFYIGLQPQAFHKYLSGPQQMRPNILGRSADMLNDLYTMSV